MTKFIFVTGGVLSALGKGIAAASIGRLLESRGFKLTIIKLDPYLNVDSGTMSPYQHGEVYVTDDGAETDLDLGHYERFTSTQTTKYHNWTAGRIYDIILKKERRGEFLGKTVQVIPHVTDEIKNALKSVAESNDIVIAEIGGTVGDIESLPFLEAIRQMRLSCGADHTLFVHLTYVPYVQTSGELKTKPTQHSVRELRAIGIQPDILLCRTDRSLGPEMKAKISMFTNVPENAVITARDVENIYEIPLVFAEEGLDAIILRQFGLTSRTRRLSQWKTFVRRMNQPRDEVDIAIVGKYAGLEDSYLSLKQALIHGAVAGDLKAVIEWIEAENVEKGKLEKILGTKDGILIPGGFGQRGIEGKIRAVTFAREHNVPLFGICLGMQCATIEFARNIAGLKGAHSAEFDEATPAKIFFKWRELKGVTDLGGTMRLGRYLCRLEKSSLAYKIYRNEEIWERHRHRFEFNPAFEKPLREAGLRFSGKNPDYGLAEIVELPGHPWFLGCQFHPEFKSRPLRPHPLFKSFIGASYAHRQEKRAA
ncbi:MAG: CTP synthase [Acidobacteriota bacterium]|nr:CTP synthase [Acidobacteriota bacterium]OQB56834.1 MAG: CTP synthase [Candidatus Aminicenantes bacterium ADurb.Bin147]HNQ81363.1 CTP synthase [Candidatus Aminicenantes bacterium]MDD8030011.1 CTP synthase [Acidobacteriota bacterium]MDD8032643.1 CTP synthase [Acidobacteriota bacterium]